MRSLTLLLLLACVAGVRCKTEITCDSTKKEIKGDLIVMPCVLSYTQAIFFGRKLSVHFKIEVTECVEGFRIYSENKLFKFSKKVTAEDNTIELNIGPCNKITFEDIRTSEDGLTFCMRVDCYNPDKAKCFVLATEDSCESATDCSACTKKDACGWCFSTDSCLPKAKTGNGDRCGHCDNWKSTGCTTCPENCGGSLRGKCLPDDTCKCTSNWESNTCSVYRPQKGVPCNETQTALSEFKFTHDTTIDGMRHYVISTKGKVAHLRVTSDVLLEEGSLFVKFGDRVLPNDHDLVGALLQGDAAKPKCMKDHPTSVHTYIMAPEPHMVHSGDIWLAYAGSKDPLIAVTVGYCKDGLYGWPCTDPVTIVYPLEDDKAATSKPVDIPGTTSIVKKRHIGLLRGARHYVQFEVAAETTKVAFKLDKPNKDVTIQLFRAGVEHGDKGTVMDPAPSTDWGALFSLSASSSVEAIEVLAEMEFWRCEKCHKSLAHVHVMDTSTDVSFVWDKSDEWAYIKTYIEPGTGWFSLAATTNPDVHPTRMFARRLMLPTEKNAEASSSGSTLEMDNPRHGIWFIGIHASQGRSASSTIAFSASADTCPRTCKDAGCISVEVPRMKCTTDAPACEGVKGSTYKTCNDTGVDKQGVVPVPSNGGGQPSQPEDKSPGHAAAKGSGPNVGIIILIFSVVLVVVIVAAVMWNRTHAKRHQREREVFGVQIPTMEDSDGEEDYNMPVEPDILGNVQQPGPQSDAELCLRPEATGLTQGVQE